MTTRKAKTQTPADIWRLEQIRADRDKLNSLYFLRVVLPLTLEGFPRPKAEAVLVPGRKLRWDYAYISARLAVEVQGAVWKGARGGHSSGAGITRDAAKANELACLGWSGLFVTAAQIESGEALDWTRRALKAALSRAAN